MYYGLYIVAQSYKSHASTLVLLSLLLYLVTLKFHVGGNELNEYKFK